MIGSRLGSYEILEEIGSGGMGRVYKARQEGLDRMVAVKALLPQFANDPIFVERFLREARAIAALEHPGIVTIYDVGESEKTYFFAMQFLAGRTLEEILAEHVPVPASEAASITKKVAGALGYAHDAGILHRDVKTGNIFITDDGRVVLTDFGIAWAASQTRLTMANTSLGSPGYMAPEQVEGKTLDRRADLYSLGVVLFEMLTGETPFKGDSAVSIAYQHVQAPVPSVSDFDSTVPPDLEAVTRRLMSKSPDDRHGDAEALIEDLERIERGEPIQGQSGSASPSKRRWLGIAVATTIAALGVAGALLLIRNKEDSGPEAANGTVQAAPIEAAAAAEGGEAGLADAPTPDDAPQLAQSQPTESADPTEIAPAAHDVAAGETPGEPAGTARTFLVTSQPEGARVRLNGQELVQETPVSVDLEPGVAHEVSLSLDGHEPAGWSFSLDDLNDAQDSSGELHFPLKSSIPPAALSLSAPFQFQLQIDGKTYESPISELALEPGSYQIRIEAPTVFYAETRRINLESGVSSTLDLPALAPLTVAATPSLCRIRIDGRDAGYVPIQLDIAVGTHEFQFDWENLGKTLTLTRAVTNETGRVFAAAPTP